MKFINHFIIIFFNFKILHTFQHIINIQLIKNKIKIKYSLINLGYNKSRKFLFNYVDKNIIYGHKNNNIQNIKQLNLEHIWCQKYFDYKEPMKSDLHIMYLSNSKINSHRQDYKFCDISNNFVFINNDGVIIDKNFFNQFLNSHLYKKNSSKKIFEPATKSKGKISRSIAYYHSIYSDTEYNSSIEKIINNKYLLEWNRKYLPNINEIQRNEIIRINQQNINPYIKYPILIELIYLNDLNSKYIIKLGFYTIFTIIISDIFKFNYFLKKY